ncbi:MAG: outer membrane beta-barrel protein [Woeseiaceae bacterium]
MKRLITLAAVLLLSAPAMAGALSYNYIEGGYQRIELDAGPFDVSADAFSIDGSFEIGENAFVFAGYNTADFDEGIDLSEFDIGVGYAVPISNNTDFYGKLAWITTELDANGFNSLDDSGIGAAIGVRSLISPAFEVFGEISYVDLDDAGDGTAIGGGAWWNLNEVVSLGLDIQVDDDVTAYGAAVRFYFGK